MIGIQLLTVKFFQLCCLFVNFQVKCWGGGMEASNKFGSRSPGSYTLDRDVETTEESSSYLLVHLDEGPLIFHLWQVS